MWDCADARNPVNARWLAVLHLGILLNRCPTGAVCLTYGSAMRRSVSLIILFGKAMMSM